MKFITKEKKRKGGVWPLPPTPAKLSLHHSKSALTANIEHCNYTRGVQDEAVSSEMDVETQQRALVYAIEQQELNHPRDDYREQLEITIILLGRVPSKGIRFMKPGAMHRACFSLCLISFTL